MSPKASARSGRVYRFRASLRPPRDAGRSRSALGPTLLVTGVVMTTIALFVLWDHGGDWFVISRLRFSGLLPVDNVIPSYVENLMPWSVVSRPLAGVPPTIDLAVGYSKTNTSAILKLFLSRLDELISHVSKRER